MNKKGFTLIELLVVIAIIGILSSIAIVYLSDARGKANDAKVKSNITTASTQIEIDRANGGTIDAAALSAVIDKLGAVPCTTADWSEVHDTAFDNVAFYSTLCTTGNTDGDIFCADSQGYRGNITVMPTVVTGECN
ncbi:MAG: type II secretion system protein [Patescibacteria group bacterium]